jgi:hypothetical protein
MNLDLIFALTSLFSRKLCLAANLNRYPADVICLFEFSPLFDPGGFVFVGASGLGRSTVFRASAPSRGFIFRAQALRPVAAAQIGPEAAHLLHNPKMSVPGMTSTDGTGEARRTSYRLRCAGPLRSAVSECCQARILWKLWADATRLRAPKQQSNLRRCCGAPNGACITQIIGAR